MSEAHYRFTTAQRFSPWRLYTAPGVYLQFSDDHKIPNRFQRWMQERLLGWRWEYIGGTPHE